MDSYKERIVAFVDILGFKEKIKCSINNPQDAELLKTALTRIYQVKINNDYSKRISDRVKGTEVTTFSDNAVISYPAEKDYLYEIILDIIDLQVELTKCGVLIRGGLTAGKLYHDEYIVFGPAMVKAYEMESKMAIYPRIIIDRSALFQYFEDNTNEMEMFQKIVPLLECDRDGMFFIDLLRHHKGFDLDGYYHWLSDIRNIITLGLENKELSVQMKYKWFKNYFNGVVTDNTATYPNQEKMQVEELNETRTRFKSLKIE